MLDVMLGTLAGLAVGWGARAGLQRWRSRSAVADTEGHAPSLARTLEERIARLSQRERVLVDRLLNRQTSAKDPNQEFDSRTTLGERVADQVARFGGSWPFIGLFFTMMIIWMTVNREDARPFDPYPFILLNLVLSCLAALQAPIIMMSQNRQAARERIDAKNDYDVNVRAELEIVALHQKLDALRDEEWARLAQALEQQQTALGAFQQRLDAWDRRT